MRLGFGASDRGEDEYREEAVSERMTLRVARLAGIWRR